MIGYDIDHRLDVDEGPGHRAWNNDHDPVLAVDPPQLSSSAVPTRTAAQ